MHIDVCEPFNAHASGGYEYFNTFTDDYSRYGLFTLCIGNPMAWINSRNFKEDLENRLGEQFTALRYDQCEEYMSSEFDSFIKEYRIISQLSAPRTLQQNGVAKRRNSYDIARSMMSFSILYLNW